MGFLTDLAGSLITGLDNVNEEMEEMKGRLDRCSDEELKRIFKSTSTSSHDGKIKKMAAASLLMDRGYYTN